MVRTYKKTPGTRAYKNYTADDLEEALQKVTDGDLSIHAASIQYKIPFGTLFIFLQCEGPQVGHFILAKFQSTKGKKTCKYVCTIEDVSENKIVVKGLKSVKKDKKKFRVVEDDISIIEVTDIIMFLPQPESELSFYVFPEDINVV